MLRTFGFAVFRLLVRMRRIFVRCIAMLRGCAVRVLIAVRLARILRSGALGVWDGPDLAGFARIVMH